ncbi:MAG: GAF domain-containing protein [Leptolyngbyaceae cyanobacterium bins.302]|nr:GAF domain-containing protein [Leptolyngbyaceae cyanobacterium bins.302]
MFSDSPRLPIDSSLLLNGSDRSLTAAEFEALQHRVAELEAQNRLLQEEKQAAQEQAAKLEKANEVLQRSLHALATEPNLEKFLGQVLGAIAAQFNAPLAEYWYHPEDTAYIGMMSWNGQVYNRDEIMAFHPEHPGIPGFLAPSEMIHGEDLHHRQRYFIIEDWLTDPIVKGAAWMPANGLYKEINVPMVFGNNCFGALIVRMTCEQLITPQQISLAETLAYQATLAVQLTHLAEEAKHAAIAREQEKAAQERAAELAKANTAMRQSLDAIAVDSDLNQFINHVLRVVAEQLDAPVTEYWSVSETIARLELSCWRGEILTKQQLDADPRTHGLLIPPEMSAHEVLTERQQHFVIDDLPNDPIHRRFFYSLGFDLDTWCRERGVRKLLNVPLRLSVQAIGALVIYLPAEQHFTEQQIELAYALAQQVTLAIQLTRLAEEAKQAAIAREREKAAQEWAVELSKANTALRQSIDALTTQPTIEAFLSVTLQSIAEVLEVPSACLWHYEGDLAYLRLVYQDEQVLLAEQTHHPNAKQPAHLGKESYDLGMTLRTQPYLYPIDNLMKALSPEQYHMFQQLGVRCLLFAPIVISDRVVGSITARLTQDLPDPSSSRLKLINTLANQAALALQMSQLAEESKQAVVLDERNRMAQEIHDTLAQAFTGILIQMEAIQPEKPAFNPAALPRIRQLAEDGLAEARRSVRSLRPCELENSNLFTALPQLVDRISVKANLPIQLALTGDPYPLPADTAGNLLRIAQEAIHNALKHAQPNTIRVDLLYEAATVMLSIEDDGQGFDPQQQILPTGFGIIGMQERADRIGGQFSLSSGIGKGTTITVIVETRTHTP